MLRVASWKEKGLDNFDILQSKKRVGYFVEGDVGM